MDHGQLTAHNNSHLLAHSAEPIPCKDQTIFLIATLILLQSCKQTDLSEKLSHISAETS